MKIRSMILSLSAAALLAPMACLAADDATPASTDPATVTTEAKPKKLETLCDNVTGTRIRPSRSNNCASAARPFRTYTQEELERTGEVDLSEALRKIDPIFL
jgi:hypothetical protein